MQVPHQPGQGVEALRPLRGTTRGLHVVGTGVAVVGAVQRFKNGDYIGGALDLVQAGASLYAASRSCFCAEVPLETPQGSKRISDIEEGEYVLSRDEHDPLGPIVAKQVLHKFVLTGQIWHLVVNGRLIRTTGEHPFYCVRLGRWAAVHELQVGDVLVRGRGEKNLVVEEVCDTGTFETVYNLYVADFHTYFVGCQEWGWSVWAHNTDYTHELEKKDSAARKQLDRNLGGVANDGKVGHHLIPWELRDHPVVKAAAKAGFNINGEENGVHIKQTGADTDVHPKGYKHPQYNKDVGEMLDTLHQRPLSNAESASELKALAAKLRTGLQNRNSKMGGAYELLGE